MVDFKIVLFLQDFLRCMCDGSLIHERHLTRVILVQLVLFRLLIRVDCSTVMTLNAVHHFLMISFLSISLIAFLRLSWIGIDELLLA